MKKTEFLECFRENIILFSKNKKTVLKVADPHSFRNLDEKEQKKFLEKLGVEFSISYPNLFLKTQTHNTKGGFLTISHIYVSDHKFNSTAIGYDKNKKLSILKSVSEGYERYSFYKNLKKRVFPNLFSLEYSGSNFITKKIDDEKVGLIVNGYKTEFESILNSSSGMSAHTNLNKSLEKSVCEFSENDSLNKLHLGKVTPKLIKRIPNKFSHRISDIKENGFEIYCFDISFNKKGFHILLVVKGKDGEMYSGSSCALESLSAFNSSLIEIESFVFGKKFFDKVDDKNQSVLKKLIQCGENGEFDPKIKYTIKDLLESMQGKWYFYTESYLYKKRKIYVTRVFSLNE